MSVSPSTVQRLPQAVVTTMIDDEAALLDDIRFALRGLDPWPPQGSARPSEDYVRKVVEHLKLCGWEVHQPMPRGAHFDAAQAAAGGGSGFLRPHLRPSRSKPRP